MAVHGRGFSRYILPLLKFVWQQLTSLLLYTGFRKKQLDREISFKIAVEAGCSGRASHLHVLPFLSKDALCMQTLNRFLTISSWLWT